jgi:hypothetical protein
VLFNRKCQSCIDKDKQIEYLQKLVDNLLQNKGVAPVVGQAEAILEDTEREKADRALQERGGQRYGD